MKENNFFKRLRTEIRRNYRKYLLTGVAVLGLVALGGCAPYQNAESTRVPQINTVEASGIKPELPKDCRGSAVRLSLANKSVLNNVHDVIEPSAVVVRRMQVAGPNGAIYNKVVLLTAQHPFSALTNILALHDSNIDSLLIETKARPDLPETTTFVDLVSAVQAVDDQGNLIDIAIVTVIDTRNVLSTDIQPVKNIATWTDSGSAIYLAHYPTQAGVESLMVSQLNVSNFDHKYDIPDYYGQEYMTFEIVDSTSYVDGGSSGGGGCVTTVQYPDGVLTFIITNKDGFKTNKVIVKSIPSSINGQIEAQVNSTPYNLPP
ncbi:hypothetical protein A2954_01595 [Candidatus Roizmanbacteria bacterium RIFCSPLOWO2_01_FULL_37_12]|uniref:Uncharacterized protein n=1 Tax=Candidatus Roizmanbacteria bacterium RIFCSPLOWO2_01_FULL_37_12 TaxID=1802056 RepID=A0A1F7IA12_9BACT|nr:MAG: hypothetical protein A3D76_05505 [Candidatus Roizmanbacteria bacterium RIFCSPHIGHO2_02_FULL_37_9b]OGK40189.1 MAG: hypothetical protein A2954_01595 [Candidatus Roizmanbacteria bacterium RIFCSPLOWO2_01_FULL_37_12]